MFMFGTEHSEKDVTDILPLIYKGCEEIGDGEVVTLRLTELYKPKLTPRGLAYPMAEKIRARLAERYDIDFFQDRRAHVGTVARAFICKRMSKEGCSVNTVADALGCSRSAIDRIDPMEVLDHPWRYARTKDNIDWEEFWDILQGIDLSEG